ncbi:MAG: hypothetical protein QM765_37530 [Myxococcales bacterium]
MVRLLNAAGFEERARFAAHEGTVRAVSFKPDGTELLTSASDGTVRRWDLSGLQAEPRAGRDAALARYGLSL